MMDAAEQYEVADIVEDLLKLRTQMKEHSLKIEDCLRGAEIWAHLSKLQVDPDEAGEFAEALCARAYVKGVTAEKLVEYSGMLAILSEETGKTYEELMDELEERKTLNEQLAHENRKLTEEIQVNRDALAQELREAEASLTSLQEYMALKKTLAGKGLDINRLDDLSALLENLEQQGYDPRKVADIYKGAVDLEAHVKWLGEERDRLQGDIEEMMGEARSLREEAAGYMDFKLSVERLRARSLTPEMMMTLADTVASIGRTNGLSPSEAMEAFKNMIDSGFDSGLGFTTLVDDLRSHSEALKRSLEDRRDQLESLEEIIEARRQALKALQTMANSGISDRELVDWKTILEAVGYDVAAFREELARMGEMDRVLSERRREILEINTRIASAKRMLELTEAQASTNADNILRAMRSLEENVNTQGVRIQDNLRKIDEYIGEDETGFKSRTRAMVEEAYNKTGELVDEAQARWEASLNELQTTIERMEHQAQRVLQGAYEAGRTIGRYDALEKSNRLLLGEELSGVDSAIASLMIASRLRDWFKTLKASEMVVTCDRIIEYLEKRQLGLRS